MAKVRRSFQQPVKLLLYHLIFLFRNLKIRSIAELVLIRLNITIQENTNALQFKRSKYASQRGNLWRQWFKLSFLWSGQFHQMRHEMCLALRFPYTSDFALRAVTPRLLTVTGFTLVLTEVPWSTRCGVLGLPCTGLPCKQCAGKVPENKSYVNTPEDLPEWGKDGQISPRYLPPLRDDRI